MNTEQIYTVLNEINSQSTGLTTVQVVDTASFVAMGNAVLSSSNNVEPFLNVMIQKVFKTIMVDRPYRSRFQFLLMSDEEYGAILQKVWVEMPDIVEDATIPLTDGQSVDQYIVNKPKAHQSLFVKRPTAQMFITIQRKWLKEAFLSEAAMSRFIQTVFQMCYNKLELTYENMAKGAVCNMIAQVADDNGNATITNGVSTGTQVINLTTLWNNIPNTRLYYYGEQNATTGITTSTHPQYGIEGVLRDKIFAKWICSYIREVRDGMESMSTLYNVQGAQRHTPREYQRAIFNSKFVSMVDSLVKSDSYNPEYLNIDRDITTPFWQGTGTDINQWESQTNVHVTIEQTDGTEKEINLSNVIGVVFDRDAIGCYRKQEDVRTTPLNARGDYYNTFWDLNDMWINDTSENCVIFTLN